MNGEHLNDEQLSARLDGVLDAAEEARIDAHLASCEECAARLEAFATLDGSLNDALTHDPGDAYFADFADRVAARIAADPKGEAALAREAAGVAGSGGDAADAPALKPRKANPFAWLFTPRGLAFAGSAAVLVVAVGLGVQWYGQRGAIVSTMAGDAAGVRAPQSAASEAPPQVSSMQATDSSVGSLAASPELAKNDVAAGANTPEPAKDVASGAALATGTSPDRPAVAKQTVPGALPLSPRAELAPGAARDAARAREAERRSAIASTPAPPPAPVATRASAPATTNATPSEGVAMSEVAQATDAASPKSAPEAVPPQTPARAKVTDALTQSLRANSPLGKSLAGAPAPPAEKREFGFRGGHSGESRLSIDDAVNDARCGVVRDTRGTPLAAAQVRLSGAQPANTRSGADGRFCFEAAPRVGDTLIVMHVGFEPVRIPITGPAALAVSMEPVGTLGEKGGMLTGFAAKVAPKTEPKAAPSADVYASQSDVVRAAVTAARAQAALAARERTAESYEKLVVLWDDVAERTNGAATYDARFRSLEALHDAHAIAPEPARADRLRHALEAFVAATPRTLPERATVLRWQQELRSR